MNAFHMFAVATIMIAAASSCRAQAAISSDKVPERMPNDIPYGAPIDLKRADRVIDAALAESQKRAWKEVCAVVDSGGNLVSLKRMDGAQLASIKISIHKAQTSVTFRRETKAFEMSIQGGNYYQLTLDGMIASRGGVPLLDRGKLIGAIGCSGGTASQDEVIAKAGVSALHEADKWKFRSRRSPGSRSGAISHVVRRA